MPCPLALRDQTIISLAFARTKRAEAAAWPVVSANLLAAWDAIIAAHESHLAELDALIQCVKTEAA